MVFEQLISTTWLQRRPLYAVLLGLLYTFIGAGTGFIFFRQSFSLSMLFLVTLLLVPSLMNLLTIEEDRERKEGLQHFFHNHKDVFEIYLFLSVGVFVGYLIVAWILFVTGINLDLALGEQVRVLGDSLTVEKIQQFDVNRFSHAIGIFFSNVMVALIFFVLSLFYGAGSIFLMTWNASIFSTFIYMTVKSIGKGVEHSFALMGIFSLYMIPEIAGFLFAAIAGGVISKAVVTEEFFGKPFKNVIRDGLVLLLIAFGILFVAAFLEAYLGVSLIKGLV